jgi:hypothetical protein
MPSASLRYLRSFRRCALAFPLVTALLSLAGCRLYEPPRYSRLQFSPGARQTRVLMIGDSLTYYNDLPGLLQQFSTGESAPIYIEQCTTPLASLSWHWDMDNSRERIRDGHFDYVILQDFSRKPVTDPEDSIRYFTLFDGEARSTGAKTIIFENWTRRDKESEFDALLKTYRRIEDQTHGTPAPIGTAWRQCAATRPDIKLLLDDRHPTDAGSYLTACVLYNVIYSKRSSDLPENLPGPHLSVEVLKTLRIIADQSAS